MDTLQKQLWIQNHSLHAEQKVLTRDFPAHQHDFFEIEYIIDGSGEYRINGTSFPIRRNTLFFITPADFHSVETSHTRLITVMFSPEHIDTDAIFHLIRLGSHYSFQDSDPTGQLIELLLREVVSSFAAENSSDSLQYLSCVIRKLVSSSKSNADPTPSHIRTALIYILEHFRDGITLEQTAAHVGLVPAYLSSLFHKYTGTSFKQYLDAIRFEYALRLLTYTDLSVMEICECSGFRNYANFERRFKVKYGVSPRRMREEKK